MTIKDIRKWRKDFESGWAMLVGIGDSEDEAVAFALRALQDCLSGMEKLRLDTMMRVVQLPGRPLYECQIMARKHK